MELINEIYSQKSSKDIYIDYPAVETFIASIRKNVTYIAAGIIFNEKDEVLLISEAKKSCYAKWYLPAGRVEPAETIVEGLKREVLEESGFECVPLYISSIELQDNWFRFNFLCTITGGTLKTLEKADNESLEANWFSLSSLTNHSVVLRHTDIVSVINMAFEIRKKSIVNLQIIPILNSYKSILTRILIIHITEKKKYYVVMSTRDKSKIHLPTSDFGDTTSAIFKIFEKLFNKKVLLEKISLLSIEHDGREHNDGMLLTYFYHIPNQELITILDSNFEWLEITDPHMQLNFHNLIQHSSSVRCTFL